MLLNFVFAALHVQTLVYQLDLSNVFLTRLTIFENQVLRKLFPRVKLTFLEIEVILAYFLVLFSGIHLVDLIFTIRLAFSKIPIFQNFPFCLALPFENPQTICRTYHKNHQFYFLPPSCIVLFAHDEFCYEVIPAIEQYRIIVFSLIS